MKIEKFNINKKSPVFIIAELSANHNGSLETAIETIRAAKRAGADCIKLQTYTADTITIDSCNDDFIIKGTIWEGKKMYELSNEPKFFYSQEYGDHMVEYDDKLLLALKKFIQSLN